jgi:nucleoid DNA-binding protein
VISDLVFFSHATVLNKKELIEDIRGKYPDLKKTHIESFVKECFEK